MTPDVRHQHLVVRAEIDTPPTAADISKIETWMRTLIEKIEMKVMFGPQAMFCDVAGNKGMTAFAIIETSHLALHSWCECSPAILQLDVYTCSNLNVDDVISAVDVFSPTKVEYKFLDRENGLILLDERAA